MQDEMNMEEYNGHTRAILKLVHVIVQNCDKSIAEKAIEDAMEELGENKKTTADGEK